MIDQFGGGATGGRDLSHGRGGAFGPDGKLFAGIHKRLTHWLKRRTRGTNGVGEADGS